MPSRYYKEHEKELRKIANDFDYRAKRIRALLKSEKLKDE
jgi:hypothetical protein